MGKFLSAIEENIKIHISKEEKMKQYYGKTTIDYPIFEGFTFIGIGQPNDGQYVFNISQMKTISGAIPFKMIGDSGQLYFIYEKNQEKEKEKGNFTKACQWLVEGKKVRIASWHPDLYIVADILGTVVYNSGLGKFFLFKDIIEAEDWVIFEE